MNGMYTWTSGKPEITPSWFLLPLLPTWKHITTIYLEIHNCGVNNKKDLWPLSLLWFKLEWGFNLMEDICKMLGQMAVNMKLFSFVRPNCCSVNCKTKRGLSYVWVWSSTLTRAISLSLKNLWLWAVVFPLINILLWTREICNSIHIFS